MRISLLICWILIVASCASDNLVVKNEVQVLVEYLKENEKSVIPITQLPPSVLDSLESISDFIEKVERLQVDNQAFLDTLYVASGLLPINLVKNNGDANFGAYLRACRGTGAFGINEYRVIELKRIRGGGFRGRDILVKFDDNCNTYLVDFGRDKPFSSACFEILESKYFTRSLRGLNPVFDMINATDISSTAYVHNLGLICDGYSYTLDYTRNVNNLDSWIHLSKDCPGEKTGIYLVVEEVMKVAIANREE